MSYLSANDPDESGNYPDKDVMIEAILEDVGGDIPTLEDWAAAWLETKSYADLYEMVKDIAESRA